MTEFLIANIAPLMFAALVVVLLIGYPVSFALGAVGIGFGLLGIELGLLQPTLLQALPERIWGVMSNDTLLAVPFFTFMGLILERSGMAEDLLDTIGQLFGPIRGGLAYAVIFVGALLAATTGVVAASVISMGLISLPIMLRYGYDRRLASGVIAASGTLAQIIPPSLVLIIMADQLGKSVGDMYAGAFIPGLTLAALYAVYVIGIVDREAAVGAGAAARRRARCASRTAVVRQPFAAGGRGSRGGGRSRVLDDLLRPLPPGNGDRRADRHLDVGRRRRRLRRGGRQQAAEARPAVEDRRARHVRADPAARADLPRARHDLPRRRHADRGRRDGRHRRADHGARAPAAVGPAAEAGDEHDGQAVDVRRVHPDRRARVQPHVLRRQRPCLGRAPADQPARAASSAS